MSGPLSGLRGRRPASPLSRLKGFLAGILRRKFLVMMGLPLTEIINLAGFDPTRQSRGGTDRTAGGRAMGSARHFMAAVGISLFIAAGFPARQTTAQQATASTAETLAKLSATITGQYPSARALVLARGNCILHEYYANNSPDVQWPVHSVTKSVLSILVGIAIDKGLLRLDQKLPELITEAKEGTIDPRAADITLRDLLTMSSGFAPQETAEVPGVWNSSVWMIRRTVEHKPGTHFYYDNEGTNLIAIILKRAIGGNLAGFARTELFAPLQIDRYIRSEEHTSELQSLRHLVCRLLLEKKKKKKINIDRIIT